MKLHLLLLLLYAQSAIAQYKMKSCEQLGKNYQYSFMMDGISYSDIAKLYSNDSAAKQIPFFQSRTLQYLQLSFECSIVRTVIFCNENSRIEAYQLIDPVFHDSGSTLQMDFLTIQQEIRKPFFVNLSSSGKILSLQTDSTLSYSSLNIVRDIISRLQFVTVSARKDNWQTDEENTIGSFVAEYSFVGSPGNGIRYKKTNKGFKSVGADRKNQQYLPETNTLFEFDDSSQLKRLTSSEALVTTINPDTISIYAARIFLEMQAEERMSKALIKELIQLNHSYSYQKKFGISSTLSQDEINKLAFGNTLGAETFESLTHHLRLCGQFNASQSEALRLKFRALAYLYPQDCKQIGLLLKEQSYPSNGFKILSEALGHAGTVYASEALAATIEARKHELPVVMVLLPFLTDGPPSGRSINVIKSIAFDEHLESDVISTAQLVLAGMANNLSRLDSMEAGKLVLYILNNLTKVPDTLQKIHMMANTGSPLVLESLKRIIWDESTSLRYRTRAVEVLGNIHSEQSSMLLKEISTHNVKQLAEAASRKLDR